MDRKCAMSVAAGIVVAGVVAVHAFHWICSAKPVRKKGEDNPIYNLRRRLLKKLSPAGMTVYVCDEWQKTLATGTYDANDPFMRGWISVNLRCFPRPKVNRTVKEENECEH